MSVGSDGRKNVRTANYRSQLDRLGDHIAGLADAAFDAFLKNPHDPMLRLHELNDTHKGRHRNGSRAVSVTYRYRAIYVIDGDTNVWYWIGTHEDYNGYTGNT